jgi:putative ABC transport system substrate-binding protein
VATIFYVVASRESPKTYNIGILSANQDLFASSANGFVDEMARLGYLYGENIFYDIQKTNLPVGNESIIKKFIEDNVDLIFVFPTEASLEAKAVVGEKGIPIVFANALIEGTDLVESLQRPGDNVTGVRFPGVEIAARRLELLHELVPEAKRIFIPYLKDYPTMPPQLEALRQAALSLGLTLIDVPFASPQDLQTYLDAKDELSDIGMDAILQPAEPFAAIEAAVEIVSRFAAKHKIAVAGAIMLTGDYSPILINVPDSYEVGELAAHQADKILRGMSAGSLPVVSPESYLTINYRVAQKYGIEVSQGLLNRAEEIIR